TRSGATGSSQAARNEPDAGPGSTRSSPGHPTASTSSATAVSRTSLVSTPFVASAAPSTPAGPVLIRPRLGFSPTSPHAAAGMRIEPPPSLPWAIGTIPAATAAPAPPEDPPAERSGSHG